MRGLRSCLHSHGSTSRRFGQRQFPPRFERGVDMHNVQQVVERTASLMALVAGASIAGELVDCITELPAINSLELKVSRCNALLGFNLKREQVQDCLERLGTPLRTRRRGHAALHAAHVAF